MSSNDLLSGNIEVDAHSCRNFSEMAKWGRFLAVAGFILVGIFIIVALFVPGLMSKSSAYGAYSGVEASALKSGMTVGYLIMAITFFFPSLFIFRFSRKMQTAISLGSQDPFNSAIENLKYTFKFYGIIAIVILSIYVLVILFASIGLLAT